MDITQKLVNLRVGDLWTVQPDTVFSTIAEALAFAAAHDGVEVTVSTRRGTKKKTVRVLGFRPILVETEEVPADSKNFDERLREMQRLLNNPEFLARRLQELTTTEAPSPDPIEGDSERWDNCPTPGCGEQKPSNRHVCETCEDST